MAKILQVIFAVCCFVEIISAISSNNNNTKLQVLRLNITLSRLCGTIKESCGRIPIVEDLKSQHNKSEMCSSYKRVFGEVSCALKNISHNTCNNRDKITDLQKYANVLSEGIHNVSCNTVKKYTMPKFCEKLQYFVNRFLAVCV